MVELRQPTTHLLFDWQNTFQMHFFYPIQELADSVFPQLQVNSANTGNNCTMLCSPNCRDNPEDLTHFLINIYKI